MTQVLCNSCETPLSEPEGLKTEERTPCPVCGSLARRYQLEAATLTAAVSLTAAASLIVRPGEPLLASVLLQTIIVPGGKTADGIMIESVAIPWFDIIEILRRDPNAAYQIPARTWEEIIAGAYKKAGFEEVTLTPRSGDHGRDIIAIKKGLGCIRVIDQVKAYKPDHPVTADDVRALMGVLHGDSASKGFLTTTSVFAPRLPADPLISPFIPSRLGLIDGKMLLARLDELAKRAGK
jgi:restriction system protein